MICTFFEAFNVPVFWPILVMYFIMLFCITMKRQIKVKDQTFLTQSWRIGRHISHLHTDQAQHFKHCHFEFLHWLCPTSAPCRTLCYCCELRSGSLLWAICMECSLALSEVYAVHIYVWGHYVILSCSYLLMNFLIDLGAATWVLPLKSKEANVEFCCLIVFPFLPPRTIIFSTWSSTDTCPSHTERGHTKARKKQGKHLLVKTSRLSLPLLLVWSLECKVARAS